MGSASLPVKGPGSRRLDSTGVVPDKAPTNPLHRGGPVLAVRHSLRAACQRQEAHNDVQTAYYPRFLLSAPVALLCECVAVARGWHRKNASRVARRMTFFGPASSHPPHARSVAKQCGSRIRRRCRVAEGCVGHWGPDGLWRGRVSCPLPSQHIRQHLLSLAFQSLIPQLGATRVQSASMWPAPLLLARVPLDLRVRCPPPPPSADAHTSAHKSVLESAKPRTDSECASGCTWSTARAAAGLWTADPRSSQTGQGMQGLRWHNQNTFGPTEARNVQWREASGRRARQANQHHGLGRPPPPPSTCTSGGEHTPICTAMGMAECEASPAPV